jgi:hypothetical protein
MTVPVQVDDCDTGQRRTEDEESSANPSSCISRMGDGCHVGSKEADVRVLGSDVERLTITTANFSLDFPPAPQFDVRRSAAGRGQGDRDAAGSDEDS